MLRQEKNSTVRTEPAPDVVDQPVRTACTFVYTILQHRHLVGQVEVRGHRERLSQCAVQYMYINKHTSHNSIDMVAVVSKEYVKSYNSDTTVSQPVPVECWHFLAS